MFDSDAQRRGFYGQGQTKLPELDDKELKELGTSPIITGKQFILPDGTITKDLAFHNHVVKGSVADFLKRTHAVRTVQESDRYTGEPNIINFEAHHELSDAQLRILRNYAMKNRIKKYHFMGDDYTKDNLVHKQMESIPNYTAQYLPDDIRNKEN